MQVLMLCFMTTTFSDLILRVVLAFILSFAMHSEVGNLVVMANWLDNWNSTFSLFLFYKKWKIVGVNGF